MAKQPIERRYVKDFVISLGRISFGMVEVTGDLIVPRTQDSREAEKFVSMCPVCAADGVASQVKQSYRCTTNEEHGPFTIGDCSKGRQVDDKWILFPKEQVVEVRSSQLPSNILNVQVHPRKEVESRTMALGNKYIFKPKGSSMLYGILLDFLKSNTEYSLIGVVNIRKLDKIVRLVCGLNGHLLIEELLWPEDVKVVEPPSYEYAPELLEAATAFISKACHDFTPEDYTKESRQRIETMMEVVAKTGATPSITAPTPTPQDEEQDLMAMFKAALEG